MMRLVTIAGLKRMVRRRRIAVVLRELILLCDRSDERELGSKLQEVLVQWSKKGGFS